ncbi:Transcription factor TFIIIB component B'' [Gossypium arboreum]|uniref:Transcription factor TFIIIB component B n=1 Tax=Gossypium arboreum TaxID=29729 RepID=A0A0B0N2G5_GOSAR|nr:Transcription factor TFIIIB component B'' [Gossypium arboreum]
MEESDFFQDEPVVTQARAGAKFQPKFKRKAKDGASGSIPSKPPVILKDEATTVASTAINAVQVVEPDNVVYGSKGSQLINPSQVTVTDSLLAEAAVSNCCNDTNSSFERTVGENADLYFGLECLDPLLTQSSTNDGDNRTDHERTRTEEAGVFPDVDTQDIMFGMTTASGRRTGKFKPKPRLQTSVPASPPTVVEWVMHPATAQFVPSETAFEEGSIPDFPSDHVPNCAPVDLGSFIPPDPSTSECPVNEELANLAVASNAGVDLSGDVPDMPTEVSSLVSNPSRESKQSSTGGEVNGKSEARKQLREQVTTPHIVDDLEDGTCNDDGLAAELPSCYAIDEDKDDNDDDEFNVEHASPKRRTSKRSKKPVKESEKPPRKRKKANEAQEHKKANEASDNPEKEQRKKFSHSTRRKRRFVDESLLTTPEDEIDFAKVALKDLILLADYKERIAKKEAKALKEPLTDQSTQKRLNEENAHDEESSIASEQDQGIMDDQVNGSAQSDIYFNYQTLMTKEPRARWSKQDTELFYGAIRQFGPDFSLIQQLFPGRSRHQIKLKFKNEERRSPFKISEALASRASDHSYFAKVIEQLQQVSGADPEAHGDVSNDLTREEEEVTPENNEEAAKSKQDEDVSVGDQEADITQDHSSLKSNEMDDEDEDDDDEILNSYQSAF